MCDDKIVSEFRVLAAKPFECKIRADLGFIIDGSEEIDDASMTKEREFVSGVVGSFGLSDEGARAGVVVGGESSKVAIRLNEHRDALSFGKGVASIKEVGGKMRLDEALLLAYKQLFNTSNGARDSVPQVLTIVTSAVRLDEADGNSLYIASSPFHEAGIRVLVLVVGKNANKDKLSKITKQVDDIFYVEKFGELAAASLRESMAKSACKASGRYNLLNKLVV